jgi:hypothetical protein
VKRKNFVGTAGHKDRSKSLPSSGDFRIVRAKAELLRKISEELLPNASGETLVVQVIHDVEKSRIGDSRVERLDKVRVANSEFCEVSRKLKYVFSCRKARFLRKKVQKVGNEGKLCRRMELPTKGTKNLPFHFFNVLGSKLSSTKVC